jgi:hypothetical protein
VVKVLIFIILVCVFLAIFINAKKISKKMIFVNFSLILTILLFLVIFFIKSDKNISKQYNPPKFDGEKLIPGYFNEN